MGLCIRAVYSVVYLWQEFHHCDCGSARFCHAIAGEICRSSTDKVLDLVQLHASWQRTAMDYNIRISMRYMKIVLLTSLSDLTVWWQVT